MQEESIKSLRESLVELSKNSSVHFESVCSQLEQTRLAIHWKAYKGF